MLLFLSGGLTAAADPAPAAPGYPQTPAYEPVFVSSQKPLPASPPAMIARPISVAPPAATVAAPIFNVPVTPVQLVKPMPATPQSQPLPRVEDDLKTQYQVLLEPPSPEILFNHLDSEPRLVKRMRQQAMQRNPPSTVQFPERLVLSKTPYQPRALPPNGIHLEPFFVCHNRLFCEEKNAERYGWDLGLIQPAVSIAYFVRDTLSIPLVFAGRPMQGFDTNAGKYLPGEPIPYILYPQQLTGITRAASAGIVAALP